MKTSGNNLTGIGKVYRFTLAQMLKGKANIITLFIFFLITAASIPVMTLMMGGKNEASSDGAEALEIAKVYVRNDTGYELALESIPDMDEVFADTEFIDIGIADIKDKDIDIDTKQPSDGASLAAEEWTEETYESHITAADAYIHLQKDVEKGCFMVGAYTLEEKEFPDGDLDSCVSTLSSLLDTARYAQQDAEPEQIATLTSPYETSVQSVEEYLEGEEDRFDTRFGVQMIYSVVLLILCTFASSFIIQKVIEEKASKLVELLMVSVSPLAMLVGKILAVMTYVFGLIVSLAAVAGISYVITGQFADTSVLQQQAGASGIFSDILQVSPGTVLVLVISLLLGYLQVSLISGLIGTGCSSMEDVESANLVVVLMVMAGYLAATLTVGIGSNPVLTYLVTLCPVASMFCAPVRFVLGDIGIGMLAVSWLIQTVIILLLAYVCARIYRALMMYRGSRMKFGGWIEMFRQNRVKEVDCR